MEVNGPADQRTLHAPIAISCTSQRRRETWDLLQPLLFVQDLLNFAFGGFVAAEGGTATVDIAPPTDGRTEPSPSLWSGPLMVRAPATTAPESMSAFPLFSLQTLGGAAGLARWVRLCERHGRATAPVVRPFRFGAVTPSVGMLETAAGIESWVKSNRPAAWTKGPFATVLARRVGRSFSDWVGDPEKWSKAFWGTYNKLKHDTTYDPDQFEVQDLLVSGRYLLAAALLDRVAGTKAPSGQIFTKPRLNAVGLRLRERFT